MPEHRYDRNAERRLSPYREWSPSIHYAQTQTLPPGRMILRRLYDFELLYVSHGSARTHMHDRQYDLSAGQLIFLSPGVYHQNEIVSDPHAKFIGIHFDFFDELDVQGEDDMVVNEEHPKPDKFAIEAVAPDFAPLSDNPIYAPGHYAVSLMEQLVHEFAMRRPGYELVCKALMMNILAHLLRAQFARTKANATVHGSRIAEMMEAMEQAPDADWSNKSLAAKLNMNEDHMAKLFKGIAGKPPGEYLAFIRHREARRLLRETDLTVELVGHRVGYEDLHYFSRVFKRHEGLSPREYRKLARIL
ncbi:AraC family transcriptional regulator [Paenibacillus methanolicus]|uniref:AraC-like protein n=1 Tax=Paenibacillus methanolicus TaxID=582686 RepID=A0A5S5CIJ6_9BACL|nr:AraC family transcriptional regulator [Paenibacillus methanolicus]TYP79609.1 AraC-like protein [Paenibacillus methanolicus]